MSSADEKTRASPLTPPGPGAGATGHAPPHISVENTPHVHLEDAPPITGGGVLIEELEVLEEKHLIEDGVEPEVAHKQTKSWAHFVGGQAGGLVGLSVAYPLDTIKIRYVIYLFYVFSHIYLPVCLSACLPVCLSACLPVCLSSCLPVCLSACLPVCLSACLPVCLSACLPACLPAYPSY
jgi:hypothetical protein